LKADTVVADMAEPVVDHRRAIADRNVEAILDATERLLERGAGTSVAAVAAEAGVSRVTFYAHFADREALLTAVLERAVTGAAVALAAAAPEVGPPAEALERVIAETWRQLDRHHGLAQAAAEQLSAQARDRSHEAARVPLRRLVDRGRRAGVFRKDVPAELLVALFLAVVHGAADEVRAGRLKPRAAPGAVTAAIKGLFGVA
jgi:TetR/AcrR family transcriptional regulator, mexCD-oprJ operon repressor